VLNLSHDESSPASVTPMIGVTSLLRVLTLARKVGPILGEALSPGFVNHRHPRSRRRLLSETGQAVSSCAFRCNEHKSRKLRWCVLLRYSLIGRYSIEHQHCLTFLPSKRAPVYQEPCDSQANRTQTGFRRKVLRARRQATLSVGVMVDFGVGFRHLTTCSTDPRFRR
jgi:hypothetical protein